jgi:hypothetical protein
MADKENASQRVDEPVAPATSDGRVPYADPLPTPAADAAAPDGAPRPTRPPTPDDPAAKPPEDLLWGPAPRRSDR